MHYCFITTGEWGPRPGVAYVLRRDLGNALARRGVEVSFLVDDLPGNHVDLGFEAGVRTVFVPTGGRWGELKNRRRVLGELAPDFADLLIQLTKGWLALGGQKRIGGVGAWDAW